MITIVGNKEHKLYLEIQEKLDELQVSYRMQYSSGKPFLKDGEFMVKGEKEIFSYLDELSGELNQWYYCMG